MPNGSLIFRQNGQTYLNFSFFPLPLNALGKGKNHKGVKGESGSGQFALQGYWGEGAGGTSFQCLLLQCSTQPLKSRVKELLLSVRGLGDKVVSRKRVKTESRSP